METFGREEAIRRGQSSIKHSLWVNMDHRMVKDHQFLTSNYKSRIVIANIRSYSNRVEASMHTESGERAKNVIVTILCVQLQHMYTVTRAYLALL